MDDGATTATYYVEGELSLQWDCDLGELSGLDLIGLVPDSSEENCTCKCPHLALPSSFVDVMDEKEVVPLVHNGDRSLLLSQKEVNDEKNVPLLHVLDNNKKKDLYKMVAPDCKKKDAHKLDDNKKTRLDLDVQDKKPVVAKLKDDDVVELVVPGKKTAHKPDKSDQNRAVPKLDVLDMKKAVPELGDLDEKTVIPVSSNKHESKVAHVPPSLSSSGEKNAESSMSMPSSYFFGERSIESSSQFSYTNDKSCVVPVGTISSYGPKLRLHSVDAKSTIIPPSTGESSLAGSSPSNDTKSTITSPSTHGLSQIRETPKQLNRRSNKRKRETSPLSNASKNNSSMKTSPFFEYCKDSSSESQKTIPSSEHLRLVSQRDPSLYLETATRRDRKSLQLHETNEAVQGIKRSRHKRGRRHQCPFAIGDSCRPRNSFIFFSMRERARLTAANPHFAFGEISKLLAQTWHSMSDAEKEPYRLQAQDDMSRYNVETEKHDRTWQSLTDGSHKILCVFDLSFVGEWLSKKLPEWAKYFSVSRVG